MMITIWFYAPNKYISFHLNVCLNRRVFSIDGWIQFDRNVVYAGSENQNTFLLNDNKYYRLFHSKKSLLNSYN